MAAARRLPMFPLGTVLYPYAMLPLHVFETRYRIMVRECLRTDQEFGVVLIERGSEVGGGDVRFDTGTIARIVQAAELPDGRYALASVGTKRIRVERWLPDDPLLPDYNAVHCPVAEEVGDRVVWLHHRVLLGDAGDVTELVEAIKKIRYHSEHAFSVV